MLTSQTQIRDNQQRPSRRRYQPPKTPVIPVFSPGNTTDYSLAELFNYHNEQSETLLQYSTLKHYFTTQRYLIAFLQHRYELDDIELTELDYRFIVDFEQFLYRIPPQDHRRPLQTNGVLKHMTRVKKMINLAVNLDWINKSPFRGFKLRKTEVDKSFLNKLELKKIEDKEITGKRLNTVRDLFVFACYTGLAFVDMAGLLREHIVTGIDGDPWIKSFRQKTKTPVKTPLLQPALDIMERYLKKINTSPKANIFPRISNQKMNAYLKEIAHICGISKNLTFHIARHTFATTITLSNGVPIETVSKMLGHTKLSTTQIYARVLEDKISKDMNQLKQHFATIK